MWAYDADGHDFQKDTNDQLEMQFKKETEGLIKLHQGGGWKWNMEIEFPMLVGKVDFEGGDGEKVQFQK